MGISEPYKNIYRSNKKLIIFDADGTTIDAYPAIEEAFSQHGMTLGDEESFQKRHHLFKYLGGLRDLPSNIKKNFRKKSRLKVVDSLTDVYRFEARLYPGIPELLRTLFAAPDIIVGLVTKNITNEPLETLRQLFMRHDVDLGELDFLVHIPVSESKTPQFRFARKKFDVNPARTYMCGDEYKDYLAGINAGMHPFMVSYGFEDHERLTTKFEVPEEIISRTPDELCERISHALDLTLPPRFRFTENRIAINTNTRIEAR